MQLRPFSQRAYHDKVALNYDQISMDRLQKEEEIVANILSFYFNRYVLISIYMLTKLTKCVYLEK